MEHTRALPSFLRGLQRKSLGSTLGISEAQPNPPWSSLALPAEDGPGEPRQSMGYKDFEGWGSEGCSSWDEERENHYF